MTRRPCPPRRKRNGKTRDALAAQPGRRDVPAHPTQGRPHRKTLRLARGGRPHGRITVVILAILIMAVLIVRALHSMR